MQHDAVSGLTTFRPRVGTRLAGVSHVPDVRVTSPEVAVEVPVADPDESFRAVPRGLARQLVCEPDHDTR